MKTTPILFKQHLQRQFNKKWTVLGQLKIHNNEVKKKCESIGFQVHDPLVELVPQFDKLNDDIGSVELAPATLQDKPYYYPKDSSNPDWKTVGIPTYHCQTPMLGGLEQAQVLTKSVVVRGLPQRVQNLVENPIASIEDQTVERLILKSHVLEATQDKLPRIHEGPWEINPRRHTLDYGPSKRKRNNVMIHQMVTTADRATSLLKPELSSRIFRKLPYTPLKLDIYGKEVRFEIRPAAVLLSEAPLTPYADQSLAGDLSKIKLPNIYPMSPTVNIHESNVYDDKPKTYVGPLKGTPHIHFAFFTNNVYESRDFTPTSTDGRMLVHSFAMAAAQAQLLYGPDVKTLPEPVTINAAHFEATKWIFGSYQLNSLDFNDPETKNIFWVKRTPSVFTKSKVIAGVPTVSDFNGDFFKYFLALYSSAS